MPTISSHCTAKPKRIVICCDGTWQSATGLDRKTGAASNVAKLCQILASAGTQGDREYQQVVYYDAGVGTGDIGFIQSALQGGNGSGLLENVIEAYNFIVNNFTPGDQLFFFGFSRGAFTARSTVGLVNEIGILRPSSMRKFIQMYSAFVDKGVFKTTFGATAEWSNFIKTRPDPVVVGREKQEIEVIGVWDTVGALGVPDMGHIWRRDHSDTRKPFEFHDVKLNSRVKHAFQALALDDQRESFHPSIWKILTHEPPVSTTPPVEPDNDIPQVPKDKVNNTTELVQCWFPGVHINIGGGSSSSAGEGDFQEQLASNTYVWMLDHIRPYLALDPDELASQKLDWGAALRANTVEQLEEKQAVKDDRYWSSKAFESLISVLKRREKEKPHGLAIEDIPDSHSALYDFMGPEKDRIPQNLTSKEFTDGWRTFEQVHYTVALRKQNRPDYVPHAMKEWEQKADGTWYDTRSNKFMAESVMGGGLSNKDSMEYWLKKRSEERN